MEVQFFNFSKRSNETKKPSGNGTKITVHLKDRTPIISPVLLLQSIDDFNYNYAYIPKWKRYYFVAAPVSVDDMWEVALDEDYLASYKSEIGNTKCNILYATGSTKNIADTRIPITADLLRGHEQAGLNGITITDSTMGAVFVGITGNGSFGTYLLQNNSDIKDLLDGADSYWNDLNINNTWDAIKQGWFGGSAAECLKSAIALPIVIGGPDVSTTGLEDLYLGGYPCKRSGGANIQGYHVNKPVLKCDTSISIPWQSNDWKRISQYTDIVMYLPLVGFLTIPASDAQYDSALTVRYAINVTSGDISVMVKGASSNKMFAMASGNCAMNTAFGSTGIDTNKAMQGTALGVGAIVATVSGVITGGLSTAAQLAIGASLAGAAKSTFDALGGSGYGSAGMGGGASQGIDPVIHIWVTQKQLTETQANLDSIMGKPYMAVAKPSNFSGYVQTDGFEIADNKILSIERDAINKAMDTGIYYT